MSEENCFVWKDFFNIRFLFLFILSYILLLMHKKVKRARKNQSILTAAWVSLMTNKIGPEWSSA
jgi:hypothetical protein